MDHDNGDVIDLGEMLVSELEDIEITAYSNTGESVSLFWQNNSSEEEWLPYDTIDWPRLFASGSVNIKALIDGTTVQATIRVDWIQKFD